MSRRLTLACVLGAVLWAGSASGQNVAGVEARDMGDSLGTGARLGATLWLAGGEDGPVVVSVVPIWRDTVETSRPADGGDGVWVELLSARLELLGRFPTALPEPGELCALAIPVLDTTWWVIVVERRGSQTRTLARFQLGAKLSQTPAESEPGVIH